LGYPNTVMLMKALKGRSKLSMVGIVLLSSCGPATADPAFESVTVSDVRVFGGDCAASRCVFVTAHVIGSQGGEGTCVLYGPGDPESLDPLAESGPLEMTPGQDTIWRDVELPDGAPSTADLNPVCSPMLEG
jgi:hypothetical protein